MVDWERVERLRSKGMDWDSIAADPKVSYTAPPGVEDAGRALKTLYYTRKSGRTSSGKKKADAPKPTVGSGFKSFLVPGGLGILVLGAIWFPIAYYVSFVGVLIPAVPYVLLVIIVGALLVAAGTVLNTARISENWKKPVAVGLVLGLILSGGIALAGVSLGVPNLSRVTVGEPGGWQSETPRNSVWESNNLPVVFFMGSIACPYCSASSWAFQAALQNVGTLTGTQYGASNPNDVDPNTPEVEFVSASFVSNYISLDVKEGNDDSSTAVIPPLSLEEQAYVSTYDGGGSIPFFVAGGIYSHIGTLVDPSILQGITPQQMANIMSQGNSNTGTDLTIYQTVHGQQLYFEAYIVKIDTIAGITPPSFGNDETQVQDIVSAIS